jgi:hypothetical protein
LPGIGDDVPPDRILRVLQATTSPAEPSRSSLTISRTHVADGHGIRRTDHNEHVVAEALAQLS